MAYEVGVEVSETAVLVTVGKEWLDIEGSAVLRRHLTEALTRNPGAPLILDLSAVTEICSGGLAVLVQAHRECTVDRGGRFLVAGVRPEIERVLEATRLTKLFELFPSRTEALASVAGGQTR